jgi:hypothetical protein
MDAYRQANGLSVCAEQSEWCAHGLLPLDFAKIEGLSSQCFWQGLQSFVVRSRKEREWKEDRHGKIEV